MEKKRLYLVPCIKRHPLKCGNLLSGSDTSFSTGDAGTETGGPYFSKQNDYFDKEEEQMERTDVWN